MLFMAIEKHCSLLKEIHKGKENEDQGNTCPRGSKKIFGIRNAIDSLRKGSEIKRKGFELVK